MCKRFYNDLFLSLSWLYFAIFYYLTWFKVSQKKSYQCVHYFFDYALDYSSFLSSFLVYLLDYVPDYLLYYLLDCLLDYLPDYLPNNIIDYLLDLLLDYLPDNLLDYLLDYLRYYLPDFLLDYLLDYITAYMREGSRCEPSHELSNKPKTFPLWRKIRLTRSAVGDDSPMVPLDILPELSRTKKSSPEM